MSQELVTRSTDRDDQHDVNKTTVISLRVSDVEAKAWEASAKRAGIRLSEYIRRRVNGETTIEVPPPPKKKAR